MTEKELIQGFARYSDSDMVALVRGAEGDLSELRLIVPILFREALSLLQQIDLLRRVAALRKIDLPEPGPVEKLDLETALARARAHLNQR